MMLEPFIIPVFYYSDETLDIEGEFDDDGDLSECEEREFHFYQIDGIGSYREEDKLGLKHEYCTIFSNGTRFVSSLTMEEVSRRLKNHLRRISLFMN